MSASESASSREERLAKLKAAAAQLESELAAEKADASARPPVRNSAAQADTRSTESGPKQNNSVVATATAQPDSSQPASSQAVSRQPSTADANGASAKKRPTQETAAADQDEQQATEEEHEEDEPRFDAALAAIRSAPPWLVSFILHMLLLIILGIWTLTVIDEPNQVFVIATPADPSQDELELETEFESEPVEDLEFEDLSIPTEIPDPGQIALGQLITKSTEPVAAEIGQVSLPNSVDQIGALFGHDGKGMSQLGDGFKGAATFFGSKVKGKRFVFVVDNSNSMGRGRLETALNELMNSVSKMDKSQKFYVIFFSDAAYPLFHPKPVRDLIPATEENKRKLAYWLETVQMCLRTQGKEACMAAINFRPDAIYILGDGAFTDNATDLLTAPHTRRTVINTVGMEVNERGAKQLSAIAKANRGTYRVVASSPQAQKAARTRPIAKNRFRGPVWGINLPPGG